MPAALLRKMKASEVTCPAGALVGDAAVWCGIEESHIDGHLEPSTIEHYCAGHHGVDFGYTQCPTWRAMKLQYWKDRKPLKLEAHSPAPKIEGFDPSAHFASSLTPEEMDIRERAYSADTAYSDEPVFDPETG